MSPRRIPRTIARALRAGSRQLGSPRLGRRGLRRLTVWGPAIYLALLGACVLYYHPYPLPFWPAFFLLLALSWAGTFFFSHFVFVHVQRQEEEIVRRTRELADVSEAMAVVKERQRIARELHDSLAQHLGYLHLRLADIERRVATEPSNALEAELGDLRKVAREAYEEARQGIFGLRTMVSRSLGLIPTLTEYLHEWSRQAGIAVDLRAGVEESLALAPVVEVQLIGIIQEALANVRKHARARRVVVTVERATELVTVSIRDDGVGFDPLRLPEEGRRSFGVETMRERADAVGGKLTLTSRPGEGTTVEMQVPLKEQGRAER